MSPELRPSGTGTSVSAVAAGMVAIVEDLIRLLDDASNGLRQGRFPDRGHSQKIATVMRAVADNFEA